MDQHTETLLRELRSTPADFDLRIRTSKSLHCDGRRLEANLLMLDYETAIMPTPPYSRIANDEHLFDLPYGLVFCLYNPNTRYAHLCLYNDLTLTFEEIGHMGRLGHALEEFISAHVGADTLLRERQPHRYVSTQWHPGSLEQYAQLVTYFNQHLREE